MKKHIGDFARKIPTIDETDLKKYISEVLRNGSLFLVLK